MADTVASLKRELEALKASLSKHTSNIDNPHQVKQASIGVISPLPPIGTIVAYNPGYYTGVDNAGFTVVGPSANTVAAVNAYLPANWRVCDGTALNDSSSPIWNAAGRYLPTLTSERFLRGNTTAGTQGGASSVTLTTNELPTHNHGITVNNDTHSHNFVHDVAGSLSYLSYRNTVGSVNGSYAQGNSYTTTDLTIGSDTHNHTASSANAGSGNSFSIVPKYLDTFFIIRVK